MNANANATVFPRPGFVPPRSGAPSHLVRRANKACLEAHREAEASRWTGRRNRTEAAVPPLAPRLVASASDRTDTRVMWFLLGFAIVAVGGLLQAGFASGDFHGGVRAVVEGVLR